MLDLSRNLYKENKLRERLWNKRGLDNVLLDSYWIDNIQRNDVERLRKAEMLSQEIIIVDYIRGFSKKDIIKDILTGNEDVVELLCNGFLNTKVGECSEVSKSQGRERYRSFSTPMRYMASLAYLSLIKGRQAREMLKCVGAGSKEDYKAILFVDYVSEHLSSKRREILGQCFGNGDVFGVLEKSCVLYIFQKASRKMKEINHDIRKFAKRLEKKSGIEITDIESYKRLTENPPPLVGYEIDPELAGLIDTRKKIIKRCDAIIQERKLKRKRELEDEYISIGVEFKSVDAKKLPRKNEIERVKNSIKRLDQIKDFYGGVELGSDEEISNITSLRNKTVNLVREYDEFAKNKKGLENHARKIFGDLFLFENLLGSGSFDSCKEMIKEIESYRRDTHSYLKNRYLKEHVKNIDTLVNRFYTHARDCVKRKIKEKEGEIRKLRERKDKNIFSKIFVKPFIKFNLRKLEDYVCRIEGLERLL